ncbi:hypothetical protein E3N88_34649 [Mikania micrantha]|uniref:Uncharacterized protein n=1 Tax=Mikania micrantha TaxID=192012 RepID=A0A5N6LYQ8_9ASTR|nr:hypothetical protein E3N88_34649 [Mikania micrantha]
MKAEPEKGWLNVGSMGVGRMEPCQTEGGCRMEVTGRMKQCLTRMRVANESYSTRVLLEWDGWYCFRRLEFKDEG